MKSKINNQLSQQQRNRILFRDRPKREAMRPLWGATWNLRGRVRVPLGSASMMALSYHKTDNVNRDVLELLCVNAQTDPAAGVIHYSNIRMAHDFGLQTFPGATARVLDPRDEHCAGAKQGERPNGSWVRLALEVDRQVGFASAANWRLPTSPVLPQFLAGFSACSDIDMEVTPALLADIAAHMQKPIETVAAIPMDDLQILASAHWPDLWTAPFTGNNDSNFWLIDTKYTTQLNKAVALFEDFTDLVGVQCWNPVRNIKALQLTNPARSCAAAAGVDLRQLFRVIEAGPVAHEAVVETVDEANYFMQGDPVPPMTPTEFSSSYDTAVDTLFGIRDNIRTHLGRYSPQISDTALNAAMLATDQPIVLPISSHRDLNPDDVLEAARREMEERPLFNMGVTDDDLRAAIANPDSPLYASRLCRVQVLYRNLEMDACDAFRFSPAELGRDRVFANLWAGAGWLPGVSRLERYDEPRLNKPRARKPQAKQHATT